MTSGRDRILSLTGLFVSALAISSFLGGVRALIIPWQAVAEERYFHFRMFRLAWEIFLAHLNSDLAKVALETAGWSMALFIAAALVFRLVDSGISRFSGRFSGFFLKQFTALTKGLRALCLFFILLIMVSLGAAASVMTLSGDGPPKEAPNVLLISIDTLRFDHLGLYGHTNPTTPNMDRLASRSLVFENATTQAPWTLPAMATIFTGLYPSEHQAIEKDFKIKNSYNTLTEYFKNAGYQTLGLTSHYFINSRYGFDQGFDVFDESNIKGHSGISSPGLTQTALKLMRKKKKNKPYFLWIHYFDPHYAYIFHKPHRFHTSYNGVIRSGDGHRLLRSRRKNYGDKDIQFLFDLYDSEIAFTDKHIGRLIRQMRRRGLLRNTMIVITSDHGEEMMERGWIGHTNSLYEEQVRVPLIIQLPFEKNQPRQKKRFQHRVEIRDLFATLLDFAGIKYVDDSFRKGTNLLSNESREHKRPIFTETQRMKNLRGVLSGDLKLIYDIGEDEMTLFNLADDPEETRDLYPSHHASSSPDLARMKRLLEGYMAATDSNGTLSGGEKLDLSPEELAHFRSLGYI